MNGRAYYNEYEPFAAEWLRSLIVAGHIAPGDVDERSIRDVRASDLVGYRQCHFFAGIGVWSHALRSAGWADDREVWTGSCPCQPFSKAGRGRGFADDRHLWPEFFRLIGERRPHVVFGEQVASPDGLTWLDAVSSDMEGAGYAFGSVDTCAAGFGAPHIRQRLYFVADSDAMRWEGIGGSREEGASEHCEVGRMADPGRSEHLRWSPVGDSDGAHDSASSAMQGCGGERVGPVDDAANGSAGLMAYPQHYGFYPTDGAAPEPRRDGTDDGLLVGGVGGVWEAADWIPCRDGKWRPVEPGTFPLVDGASSRVGRVRAYGNAIVGPQASEIVRAYMDGASV
jgi:DNA (cytosine-5)-methyltransferase 1